MSLASWRLRVDTTYMTDLNLHASDFRDALGPGAQFSIVNEKILNLIACGGRSNDVNCVPLQRTNGHR